MYGGNLGERRSFATPEPPNSARAPADDDSLAPALAQWIASDDRAHVLVDDGLRVCWMNASAERLMSGPNSILIRNGHIRTRENRFDRELHELIDSASAQRSTCCVHDAKSGEHLVLTAVRLAAPRDALVGLTLLLAREDFGFRLADLHSAFGLTQTEERVAWHLMCGRTAGETADNLGVSLETVRTHIKRAYAKLGVSSREAFFHRLTPFLVLLA